MSGKKIIGQPLPCPGKTRVGDILAIPLTEGQWGYVRVMRDASLAILDATSVNRILPLSKIKGCRALHDTGYCEPWDEPTWIYLGKWPFGHLDEAWPSPKWSRDVLNPVLIRIYHKGKLRQATSKDNLGDMRQDEGLLFPGHLILKIRELHGMTTNRAAIEREAPFSTGWKPHNG